MGRAEPDRAAFEFAHRQMRASMSLDEMLEHPALRTVLGTLARRHMRRRDQVVDVKRLQANDRE